MTRRVPWTAIGVLLLAGCLAALPLAAKTLRFGSGFDPQSLDPHALALLYQTRVVSQIYDSLVSRDRDFALEPALAVSWQQLEPKRWRFKLRPGVKFHDGALFTADDVAFSIERALHKNSQRAFQLRGVIEARKVDDLTVDFLLAAPDAVLPEKLIYVAMMSRAWSAAHGVEKNLKLTTKPIHGTNVGAENVPRAPRTLIETTRNFKGSKLARDWFGDDFVEHFAATREWEWRQWLDGVTDWELKRYFEII